MNLPDAILQAGAALVLVVRVTAAVDELRLRVPGRAWCGGWAAAGLLLHDVLMGLAAFAATGWSARRAIALTPASPHLTVAVTAVATGAGFVLASELLYRRHGVALRSCFRPRRTVAEPCPTLRGRLLGLAEREGRRAASRWIGARLERCRRDCGVSHEQLLPAVWPAVRLRLRDEPGIPRTEVALLLLQAQAVADDSSPAQERALTLLHLLHERAGRRAVAAALKHARRTPVRHGRPGPATWAASARAVPAPVVSAAPVPTPAPASQAPASQAPAATVVPDAAAEVPAP